MDELGQWINYSPGHVAAVVVSGASRVGTGRARAGFTARCGKISVVAFWSPVVPIFGLLLFVITGGVGGGFDGGLERKEECVRDETTGSGVDECYDRFIGQS